MALGCTVVSTVTRAKSCVRNAPLVCATRKLSASSTSLGGLDALAVDDRGQGAGVTPDPFAICYHERMVYLFKAPVVAPGGEPALNRPPRRQVVRQ